MLSETASSKTASKTASAADSRGLNAEALYQRDVNANNVLTAVEERELFLAYEKAEVAWWLAIFAHRPTVLKEAEVRLRLAEIGVAPPNVKNKEDCKRFAIAIRLVDKNRAISLEARRLAGPLPSAESFFREAKRLKDLLIVKNLRLVFLVIGRRQDNNRQDRVSSANFGLMEAVERFDVRKGFRFSTYALWWIRHHMKRGDQNTGTTVRLPVHVQDNAIKLRNMSGKFQAKHGREPTREELSEAVGMSMSKIATVEDSLCMSHVHSLDTPIGDDGVATLLDMMSSSNEDPGDVMDREARLVKTREVIARLRATLRPIDRVILDKKVLGDDRVTLESIGEEVGLTRERVRQITNKLVSKLARNVRLSFSTSSPGLSSELARRGGIAAQRAGTAHVFTSEEGRMAGLRGGMASSAAKRAKDLLA